VAKLSKLLGKLFPATQVGAYPRPNWYNVDLRGRDWKQACRDPLYREMYTDAVGVTLEDQYRSGLDLFVDGRMWYDRYDGFIGSFAMYPLERVTGVDIIPEPAAMMTMMSQIPGFSGASEVFGSLIANAQIVGKVEHKGALHFDELWKLAQSLTSVPVKTGEAMGAFELSYVAANKFYKTQREFAFDLAKVFNIELKALAKAGAKYIQLDDLGHEFAAMAGDKDALAWGTDVINEMFKGVDAYKILHACHGGTPAPIGFAPYTKFIANIADCKVDAFEMSMGQTNYPEDELKLYKQHLSHMDLGIGVISNKNYLVEEPSEIIAGIQKAQKYIDADRIYLSTDCGLITYPRVMARAKLHSIVKAAAALRKEHGAS
jgi:5-methyltetrahydropteroyltriglutamate--homocysteine methyltransferase